MAFKHIASANLPFALRFFYALYLKDLDYCYGLKFLNFVMELSVLKARVAVEL